MAMDMIRAALYGLCTANAMAVPAMGRNDPNKSDRIEGMFGGGIYDLPPGTLADAEELTLCMAESIGVCEKIDPEDMLKRLQEWENSPARSFSNDTIIPEALSRFHAGILALKCGSDLPYASAANRMFPIAVYLYLKYGENLLLYNGALEDIRKASFITHNSVEAIAGSELYCGILGKLLAGKSLHEAVSESVHMLRAYYYNRKEYAHVFKILESVDTGTDIHLQWFQLDASGTFRTTLDWATFLLFRSSSYTQCVLNAVNAPIQEIDSEKVRIYQEPNFDYYVSLFWEILKELAILLPLWLLSLLGLARSFRGENWLPFAEKVPERMTKS